VTRRLLGVGDVELCVEDFGDPHDPTILLVTGAAAAMDWWDTELCRRLARDGRHVIRYDHRDTGESTTVEPGKPAYGGWQLDQDCRALIEALAVGPVHLVGVSMGGGITQSVTLRRPDLVRTLTLIDTSAVGGVTADLPGPTEAMMDAIAHPLPDPDWADIDAYADWVVASNRPYVGSLGLDEDRFRSIARTIHARSHDVAAANNHWVVINGDGDGGSGDGGDDEPFETPRPSAPQEPPLDVRRITAPTLVLHGTDDPLFPLPHGQALADAIPGADLTEIPGMGHEHPPPPTWDVLVPALLAHTADFP
jgi:pimeloyl-ACP methyl ester carboxylesterase